MKRNMKPNIETYESITMLMEAGLESGFSKLFYRKLSSLNSLICSKHIGLEKIDEDLHNKFKAKTTAEDVNLYLLLDKDVECHFDLTEDKLGDILDRLIVDYKLCNDYEDLVLNEYDKILSLLLSRKDYQETTFDLSVDMKIIRDKLISSVSPTTLQSADTYNISAAYGGLFKLSEVVDKINKMDFSDKNKRIMETIEEKYNKLDMENNNVVKSITNLTMVVSEIITVKHNVVESLESIIITTNKALNQFNL